MDSTRFYEIHMAKLYLIQLLSVLCLLHILSSNVTNAISKAKVINNDDKNNTKNSKKQKPHIIIILADDMGWNDVSFHGSDQIPTPNIDALAYNGIILNNHYVPALCTPSRSALMTGKNPIHLGMQHNVLLASEPRGLPLKEKLLPEYLKDVGYKTHIVGKWHLGYYHKKYTPTYRGFDTHFGYWTGFHDYYNHAFADPGWPTPYNGFDMRRNMSVAWDTVGKYSTDLFTEEAVRLINAHDIKDPMFLYLAHLAPHTGFINGTLQAPSEEIAKFTYIADPERRTYAAIMSKLDHSVGEVVEALKNRGMLENSIILFMSDNGAPTEGFVNNHGSNYPLRGMKDSSWEGGIRGTAAIWSPLIKKRERVSNQLIFMTDWLPTLLSAAGVNRRRLHKIEGYDMWPILVSNGISPRREIVINIDDINNHAAIRHGSFKYVTGQASTPSIWTGDSGRTTSEKRPPYNPHDVLYSKAGVSIAEIITANQIMERRRKRITDDTVIKRSRKNILTAQKIMQLRNQAQIRCNITEQEQILCDPLVSACLFNIKKDPCEMVNIAKKQPLTAARLKLALTQHRTGMVSPSNVQRDPQANPELWNDTWTYWADRSLTTEKYITYVDHLCF